MRTGLWLAQLNASVIKSAAALAPAAGTGATQSLRYQIAGLLGTSRAVAGHQHFVIGIVTSSTVGTDQVELKALLCKQSFVAYSLYQSSTVWASKAQKRFHSRQQRSCANNAGFWVRSTNFGRNARTIQLSETKQRMSNKQSDNFAYCRGRHSAQMQSVAVLQAVCRRWRRCLQVADASFACCAQAARLAETAAPSCAHSCCFSSMPDRQEGSLPQPQSNAYSSSNTFTPVLARQQVCQV